MKEAPRLYSYIVTWDGGVAPNPYWEYCTLAVCKPQIRMVASEGDIIVGLSSKNRGYAFIFAMEVSEVLTFSEYFKDKRFEIKKPVLDAKDARLKVGDNFYQPLEDGSCKQLPSFHINLDGTENLEKKTRDLSGKHALIGRQFHYLGDAGGKIPTDLEFLIVRRGHRSRFSQKEITKLRRYIEKVPLGVNGNPHDLSRTLKRLPISPSLSLSRRT